MEAMKHHKNQSRLVADWNQKFKVGQPVYYHPVIREPERREDRTRTEAYMAASGMAVVHLENESGYVALEAVEPILRPAPEREEEAKEYKR